MMNVASQRVIILLGIFVFAVFPNHKVLSCSCTFSPSSFCTSITEEHQLILTEFIAASGPDDAWYRVVEGINNDLAGDTLLILGHDGWNCNEFAYHGLITDTLLMAVEGNGPDYRLRACGRFFLYYEQDTLKDNRVPHREVMAYADFLTDLAECQALSEYRAGTGRVVSWRDTTRGIGDFNFQINGFGLSTDPNGRYEFANIPIRAEYFSDPGVALLPAKTDVDLQFITTSDLVSIQKHILGIEVFSHPEQYLAADINGSQYITVMDVLLLRRIILNLETAFPGGESWRFVPLDYQFPNPQNPWEEEVPQTIRISYRYSSDLEEKLIYRSEDLNFRAIRLGDVTI
jgi:hypothetical protein